ncbi:MAG: 50S ribosomal protein L16 [Nitrososphaeria archaeon]|nr:50S ribosomal protein L16 [Aigarchaeota archaeon]MCX8187463.1 50S ribosomal protein L16 [Nitrososphaeria archaeon]MDW8021077.1 50S ribosomal protein L16 [Nitrososphaerota archaeon]
MKAKNWRAPERPYTRPEYVHGAPQSRISKYTAGKYSDDYEYELHLIAEEELQIRDVSLESARIALTKKLSSALGNEGFFLELKAHPHHILRENKMIFGAHADRLQEGMRRAFGKPVGRAARVSSGSPVFRVLVKAQGLQVAKEALEIASKKLPKSYRIEIKRLQPEAAA